MFVAADYHQLEVRIAAYVSQDLDLLEITNADPNSFEGDLHAQTVYKVFGIPEGVQGDHKNIRVAAKTYMFSKMYGANVDTILERLEEVALKQPDLNIEIPSRKVAQWNLTALENTYSGYFREFVPNAITHARDHECVVKTLYGRPRYLPELKSQLKEQREAAERQCVNHVIQGSAGDIARLAMLEVDKIEHGRMVLQVHDELLCEVDKGWEMWYGEKVKAAMELGQPLKGVPLVVDVTVGDTWKMCHK